MCGIALSVGNFESKEVIKKILDYQRFRGPDNTSIYKISFEEAYMGHNRLNIVDQDPLSNQPFESKCGNYVISFNGEIYNYKDLVKRFLPGFKFKTESDTEVLLELWAKMSKESIKYLIGMFAFIIYAKNENKIYVVRDRYGVKPIYYHFNESGHLTVSSQLNALSRSLSIYNNIDLNVLRIYIEYGIFDSIEDKTHIKDIKRLPSGSILEFNLSDKKINIQKYWKYELVTPKELTKREILEVNCEIEEILIDAVKIRTKSSVPFVVNLSGGIDSGALIALLENNKSLINSAPLVSYHAKYSGIDSERELNNLKHLLNKTNIDCKYVDINLDNLKDQIDELVNICDGPIGGFATIGYYQLHKAINKDGYRLAIDGQGADEVFLGYDKYLLDENEDIHVDGTKNKYFSIFSSSSFNTEEFMSMSQNKDSIYNDLFSEKLPRNLRMNDRVSMASSVELRSPFLDHRLFEKTFMLPRNLFTADRANLKHQIKKIYTDFYKKPIPIKKGKVTNQTESLLSENFALVEFSINKLSSTFHGEIDLKTATKNLNYHKAYGIDNSFQLWRIIVANSILESSLKNYS
jgi:asparagine synthase (glutamine-hydrolysing)